MSREIFAGPLTIAGSLAEPVWLSGAHDLQFGILILYRRLHTLMTHRLHDGRQVSGLLHDPRAVLLFGDSTSAFGTLHATKMSMMTAIAAIVI